MADNSQSTTNKPIIYLQWHRKNWINDRFAAHLFYDVFYDVRSMQNSQQKVIECIRMLRVCVDYRFTLVHSTPISPSQLPIDLDIKQITIINAHMCALLLPTAQ